MFDELEVSFANLDDTTRAELAEILRCRHQYQRCKIKLTELQLAAAHHPSPAAEQAINDYTMGSVAPARKQMVEATNKLLKKSVDMAKLRDTLPMATAALMQSVNLPVVLLACGLDPDAINQLVGLLKEFFNQGLNE